MAHTHTPAVVVVSSKPYLLSQRALKTAPINMQNKYGIGR